MDRSLFTRTIPFGKRGRNYQSTLQSQEISPVKTQVLTGGSTALKDAIVIGLRTTVSF